jgi:molybdenum transport protein
MIILDDATLLGYLKEDVPYGDLTTRSLGLKGAAASMSFRARGDMTLCAVEEAARLLTLIGCDVRFARASGDRLSAREVILEAEGDAEPIFAGWKVTQTLVEWASGIATSAREMVDAAHTANPDIIVACTRKAIPGTRALSSKAILSGGAVLHRTGLSDSLLLFPEHYAFASGTDGLAQQIAALKRACPERIAVVEVSSIPEALEAVRQKADILQLEKFKPNQIIELIGSLPPGAKTKIIAAGGISAANAADYARTGVAVLVSSAPYYAKPADVKVSISRKEGV